MSEFLAFGLLFFQFLLSCMDGLASSYTQSFRGHTKFNFKLSIPESRMDNQQKENVEYKRGVVGEFHSLVRDRRIPISSLMDDVVTSEVLFFNSVANATLLNPNKYLESVVLNSHPDE